MSSIIHIDKNVRFKNLTWFFFASSSLIGTGFLISADHSLVRLGILLWANIVGVSLVYRLNDCIDQDKDLKFNITNFLSFKLHQLLLLQLVVGIIPLALFFLHQDTFVILAISGLTGILYSIDFKFGSSRFRLKNIFLVKNLLIGIIWGSLILIGAGEPRHPVVDFVFLFVSMQVFIGGMIRDIPDIDKDRTNGVKSFPVVFGVPFTLVFMHLVNVGSFFAACDNDYNMVTFILLGLPVIWRGINLTLLGMNPKNPNWSQSGNLFTCVLIFIVFLFLFLS